jgi:hypothetical protein
MPVEEAFLPRARCPVASALSPARVAETRVRPRVVCLWGSWRCWRPKRHTKACMRHEACCVVVFALLYDFSGHGLLYGRIGARRCHVRERVWCKVCRYVNERRGLEVLSLETREGRWARPSARPKSDFISRHTLPCLWTSATRFAFLVAARLADSSICSDWGCRAFPRRRRRIRSIELACTHSYKRHMLGFC